MALHTRTASAFRWRPTMLDGQASDFLRVVDEGAVNLLVLANAYDSGFATCWPDGSRLILDSFVDAWASTSGHAARRLEDALAHARTKFVADAPALLTTPDLILDAPAATLLAVACAGDMAHDLWIGRGVALVVKNSEVVARTTPHTLAEQLRKEYGADVSDAALEPHIVVRLIGGSGTDDAEPSKDAFELEHGDALLLVSHELTRHDAIPGADATPKTLADAIADRGFAEGKAAYAACIATVFGTQDVPTEPEAVSR